MHICNAHNNNLGNHSYYSQYMRIKLPVASSMEYYQAVEDGSK